MNPQSTTIITHLSWGHLEITINGQVLAFRDCTVWPGGATEWDWSRTGTQHHPGILPADIEDLLNQAVEVMVLSRGFDLRLEISAEVEHLLHERGVRYHIEQTERAVDLFNQLSRQGLRVGGVFHTTC